MRLRRFLAPATLLAALSVLALGQQATLKPATIKLKDGTSVTGRPTKYDGDIQTLYFTTDDGRELVFTMDQLDARSTYLVNRTIASEDDGPRQLAVANFARDAGLYAHSSRHYRWAEQADPSLKPEVEKQAAIMRQKAGDFGLAQAREAAQKGDMADAVKWLKRILEKLPNEPQAKEASRLLDQYYARSHESRDAELEAAAPDLLSTDLKVGKQAYDSMLEKNKKALQAGSGSGSKRLFEAAIKDGERAMKELDKVTKDRKDPAVQETLAGYRERLTEEIIQIYLSLASQYMTQTSYNSALQEVNKALALDPKSRDALAMRSQIQVASSNEGGWWGFRGR